MRENGAEKRELIDPLEEKRRERSKAQSASRAMTVRELADIWYERHALIEKRESSRRIDRYNLDKSILPKLGRMRLTEVTRGDVEALKTPMKDVPVQANRVIALLSILMKYALDHEWVARNPAQGMKRYKEKPREVHLTRTELDRLLRSVRAKQASGARAGDQASGV
ncbi:MAG: tyrosine-type recombinase/integrase, partial [Candidatus Binataceae bacterium]